MTANPPTYRVGEPGGSNRLDRIEAILEVTAVQSQTTDQKIDRLTERLDHLAQLVEKHERSRMAFRQ